MNYKVKLFEQIDNDDISKVNDFLEEIGNNVVSVNTTPRGSSSQYVNYSIVYKDMSESSVEITKFSNSIRANQFIEELGNKFISIDIKERQYDTNFYVTYYKKKIKKDSTKEESKPENALG
jgi:hypothetical protein